MLTQIGILKKYGLSVKGHLGQHLLIDPNMQRRIVDLLEAEPGEEIFEIGPGLGALTGRLLERGCKVRAVEKDPQFTGILKKEFPVFLEKGFFKILEGDVLKTDIRKWLAPKKGETGRRKLVGNLPYYITAPIIFELMAVRRDLSRAVLTMQKEVAERLVASPGSKDYGRLTLGVRYGAETRHAFDIPPSCFTPSPSVHSSVMVLDFHDIRECLDPDEEKRLFDLIARAFSQRRKTLLGLLASWAQPALSRAQLEEIFSRLGFAPMVRGEELLLKDFIALGRELAAAAGQKPGAKESR